MPSTLRVKISAAAQELFLKEGLEGFSMRKVAELAGISAPAIYRHFENKEELLNEIITEGLKILEKYLEPALEEPGPEQRLHRLVDRFLDFALEQPNYFEFAFMVPSRSIDHLPEELARRNWVTYQMAVGQVTECMAQGIFREGDPLETTILLWAEAYGLIVLYRMHRFGPDAEVFKGIYGRVMERQFELLKKS